MSPKCAMLRKPYSPGSSGKRRRRSAPSEYARELKEKQKLRNWYNLREAQFRKYVNSVLDKISRSRKLQERTQADDLLINRLEKRLDNVVFRLGFACNRLQARQLVSHGHFWLNQKPVNIPSIELKKGDKVEVRANSKGRDYFQKIMVGLKKYKTPDWLKLDVKNLKGEIIGEPSLEETAPPANISSIFEFYSR